MVENTVEAERLEARLGAIDVEIHHHFLEAALAALVEELARGGADTIAREHRGHERTVEERAGRYVRQVDIGIGVGGNRRAVVQCRVVEHGDRIGIENAPARGLVLEHVAAGEDLAGIGVEVELPFGERLRGADDDLPREARLALHRSYINSACSTTPAAGGDGRDVECLGQRLRLSGSAPETSHAPRGRLP
jgi:hypothetical protein